MNFDYIVTQMAGMLSGDWTHDNDSQTQLDTLVLALFESGACIWDNGHKIKMKPSNSIVILPHDESHNMWNLVLNFIKIREIEVNTDIVATKKEEEGNMEHEILVEKAWLRDTHNIPEFGLHDTIEAGHEIMDLFKRDIYKDITEDINVVDGDINGAEIEDESHKQEFGFVTPAEGSQAQLRFESIREANKMNEGEMVTKEQAGLPNRDEINRNYQEEKQIIVCEMITEIIERLEDCLPDSLEEIEEESSFYSCTSSLEEEEL